MEGQFYGNERGALADEGEVLESGRVFCYGKKESFGMERFFGYGVGGDQEENRAKEKEMK